MATHRIVFVLMYNHRADVVSWQTVSDCARLEAALPHMEQIPETHARYAELAARCIPMPEAYAEEVHAAPPPNVA